ncbi:hypothetical protein Tco_0969821 [Tanacetum coccineum]
MYDGVRLHSAKLTIDSPDSEETLEDAEESRLKMRNKMVQINYGKLNALYEIFVPQQEFSVEETYFSIPSTSNNGSESKEVTSDLLIPKMPKEKTSGTILCVTPLPKNIAVKAKNVSNTKLRNFIEKFMGTLCFGNDHFATITGYGDYVQGNLTICHVYYVEGLAEQVATEPNSPVLIENADELDQEDVVEFDGNMFYNPPPTPVFEEAESSSTYQDPSTLCSKVCMYASTVSTIEPKNIKEAMLDHIWIEFMQDELNHFKPLDVWELFECPIGRNIIAVKWIWKNKTDVENTII